jgi:hypothetical protein
VNSIVNYLTIIAYASEAFNNARSDVSSATWVTQFARSRSKNNHRSQEVTTLLSLLSAALRNKQPLPPYIKCPSQFDLSEQIQESDANIMALSNINEPGFRAFAVIEVAHVCLVDSISVIVKNVRELVGEVNFSYQIKTSFAGTSTSALVETAEGKQKAH